MKKSIREIVEEETPHPQRAIEDFMVNVEPKNLKTAHCEKHGDYEIHYTQAFSNKFLIHSTCTKCVNERDAYVEQEITKREAEAEAKRIEDKILSCGVSKRNLNKKFDTYITTTPAQTKAKALYKDFADSVCNDSIAKSLIVCGSVGTGKTHLASSAVNQIINNGKICKLIKIIDLIRQFKSTWSKDNDSTEEDFLNYYTNIPALIIDEVGVQFGSDTEKMVIFDIIDGRYNNMLPTALISNLALPDVQELIGERAIDRMREDGGVVVAMSWDSHRGIK